MSRAMAVRPVFMNTETINRELDAQLMFAVSFARPGMRFYLGTVAALNAISGACANGVALGKLCDPLFPGGDQNYFAQLKRRGFTAIHLDDEGAVFVAGEDEWRLILERRLDVGFMDERDFVCTWGEWQREVYTRRRPSFASQVVVTGHYRFDLYREGVRDFFERETRRLRERYGRFVLLNTNLPDANHGAGPRAVFAIKNGFDPASPRRRGVIINRWASSATLIGNILKLANRISLEFPDRNVVIRPHPSENMELYETVFRDIPNVFVVREGGVAPWILAADALVHDGCTTGIEAYLMDQNVLRYRSIDDKETEVFLPNQFGLRCESEDDVIDSLRRIAAGETLGKRVARIDEYVRSLFRNAVEPAVPLVSNVLERAMSEHPEEAVIDEAGVEARIRAFDLVRAAKSAVRPLFPERMKMSRYSNSKFPGFNVENVANRVERLERVLGKKVRHRVINSMLISVEA